MVIQIHSDVDAAAIYANQYGAAPDLVARAPGRVNLIGEHTDYNEGFVFPAAIDRNFVIAVGRHQDENLVRVWSENYKEHESFKTDEIAKNPDKSWCDYLKATVATLIKRGYKLSGFSAVTWGDIPQGAGLSSSAAYEVGVATALNHLFNLGINGKDIALIAQEAENSFIGVRCGIMDQFVSSLGKADSALLIDCRSLDYQTVPLNLKEHGLAIVITNSGVRRGLVESEYNTRRSQCEDGVQQLAKLLQRPLNSLRDVTLPELESHRGDLAELVYKRCKHVISENERVQRAVNALKNGKLQLFGELLNASHTSLRDDFAVSSPPVDVLVELTQAHPGVIGSRMTGAGFGGCTVSVMAESSVESYVTTVLPRYESKTSKKPEAYVCFAADGAGIVSTESK